MNHFLFIHLVTLHFFRRMIQIFKEINCDAQLLLKVLFFLNKDKIEATLIVSGTCFLMGLFRRSFLLGFLRYILI